jgi:vitamin B12 transporter
LVASLETGPAKLTVRSFQGEGDYMFVRKLSHLHRHLRLSLLATLLSIVCAGSLYAQSTTLQGKVEDSLGSPVSGAKIVLFQDAQEVAKTVSDAQGVFAITAPASGRYTAQVTAAGFATQILDAIFLAANKTENLIVSLRIGSLPQQIVVSATGTPTPIAQVGSSVTLIDNDQISALNKLDVLEDLRLVPGAQIVQSGQRGGITSLFIRGGESNFNKVLIDGIPVNSIGGAFDYAQLSNNGVESVEVLRGSNSVLYGSDALAGVVNITSQRGTTLIPELKYSADGGNFSTVNQDVSLAGAVRRFDYSSEFSRFDTQGSFPNNFFHNATVSANLGYQLTANTSIRATVRHANADAGSPNAIAFDGISDDSTQRNHNTFVGITANQQTTERWHNSVQFAYGQFSSLFINPSPTGEPFDPNVGTPFDFGPNYLGNPVTIKGANGFSVSGQAILDFAGVYPEMFPDYEARRSIYAQSDYRFFGDWTGLVGFRYEHENGEGLTRDNYSSFLEGHGSVGHRLFLTGGVGLESNAVFGFAASPRVSTAYYLRRPSNGTLFGDTKLKFNFGKGIKEPSTFEQSSALINVLTPAQIAQFNVEPIGPERSKTYDFGVEQRMFNGHAIVGVTYFYNRFYDLISFLDAAALVSIGVDPGAAMATPFGGGAYVNATSERSLGTEFEAKTFLGHGLILQGQYTYLDSVVTRAFGNASFNPSFPAIPIGAFSPLQGARPFNRAPHSGNFALLYKRNKFNAAFSSYFIGRRDASTFLEDGFSGNSLLLPNHNLAPGYEKFDLAAGYAFTSYIKAYTSIENLFSQHYQPVFGFPALPFTIRSGITLTLGGHEGWWKH